MSKLQDLSRKLRESGDELSTSEIVNISDLSAMALMAGDDPVGTFGDGGNSQCNNPGCTSGSNTSCTNGSCVTSGDPGMNNSGCTNTSCR